MLQTSLENQSPTQTHIHAPTPDQVFSVFTQAPHRCRNTESQRSGSLWGVGREGGSHNTAPVSSMVGWFPHDEDSFLKQRKEQGGTFLSTFTWAKEGWNTYCNSQSSFLSFVVHEHSSETLVMCLLSVPVCSVLAFVILLCLHRYVCAKLGPAGSRAANHMPLFTRNFFSLWTCLQLLRLLGFPGFWHLSSTSPSASHPFGLMNIPFQTRWTLVLHTLLNSVHPSDFDAIYPCLPTC